jgi:GNAT superfamily N-acetyltransferase
MKTFS